MGFSEIIESIGKPYFRDPSADIAIYCGDCRELLPLIPDKSIGLVLTDPPYGYNYYKTDIKLGVEIYKGLFQLHSSIAIFGYPENLIDLCVKLQVVPKEWVTWWSLNKRVRSNILPREQECIAIWGESFNNKQLRQPRLSDKWLKRLWQQLGANQESYLADVWAYSAPSMAFNSVNRLHPNEKPTQVIDNLLLLCSNIDDIILDPFLGSGTTAYCAKKLGRKCIGIEIEEKYCEIAAKRCSQSVFKLDC